MKRIAHFIWGIFYSCFVVVFFAFLIPFMLYFAMKGVNIFFGYKFYAPFWYEDIWEVVLFWNLFSWLFLWIPIFLKVVFEKIKLQMVVIISLVLLLFPLSGMWLWMRLDFESLKSLFKTETVFSADNFEAKFYKVKKGEDYDEVGKLLGIPFRMTEKSGVKICEYSKPKKDNKYCSYLFYAVVFNKNNKAVFKYRKFVPILGEYNLYSPVFIMKRKKRRGMYYHKLVLNDKFLEKYIREEKYFDISFPVSGCAYESGFYYKSDINGMIKE